jgi:site-specific recombinase XerD
MINHNNDLHISSAIDIYLNWKATHTNKAVYPYKVRLKHFSNFIQTIYPCGNINLIRGDDIVAYHKQMKHKYSDATIAYSARILRNFFDFFKGRNITHLNPKEIRSVRYLNKQKDVVSENEVQLMIDQLDGAFVGDLQKELVIRLLWDTGMRVGELLDLKLSDINHQNDQGLRTASLKTKKSYRYNLVVWRKSTDDILNTYLGWRLSVNPDNPFLIIPTSSRYKSSHALSPRSVQRWIKMLSKKAGIQKQLTPHSFRHGRAHYILDKDGSAVDVQAILRHKNLHSSLNYMQLNPHQYLKTASKYLDAGISKELFGMKVISTNLVSDN